MKLDLSEIAAHLGKRINYSLNEKPIVDAESGLRCIDPIVGQIAFSNTGRTIDVRGKFQTVVSLECGRCLKAYVMPIESNIEESLPLEGQPWALAAIESDQEELPEDEVEPLFVDNIFDLGEYLRQSILVNMPIKPLCDEVCKGLCPRCGINLNDQTCECEEEPEESPFGALKSLLEEEQEN